MRSLLAEIRDGSFAAKWIAENEAGRQTFLHHRVRDRNHNLEVTGRSLRAMMPFLEPRDAPEPRPASHAPEADQTRAANQRHAAKQLHEERLPV
jgi:ketol-acid reductoisomerase